MDYERIALLLAGCTTPAFRRSLLTSPHNTLARCGFHPSEVALLVAALCKLQAQPSQGATDGGGGEGKVKFGPISGVQHHTNMSSQLDAKNTMSDEWFASGI